MARFFDPEVTPIRDHATHPGDITFLTINKRLEQKELQYIADCLETPGGIRKLKRFIRDSFPKEYRTAS